MNKKLLVVLCTILIAAGGAFIGASSNDSMTSRDTLWLILGLLCLAASLGIYGWFTRDEPLTRDPNALFGAVLLVIGLVLLTALSGFWNVIGIIDMVAGLGLLQKASTHEKARKATLQTAPS